MSEAPFQANDPKQVKKRQDKAKFQRDQQQTDLIALLKLPEFRRYIWRHMNETCGLMQCAFSTNGTLQSLNIAKQDVAKAIWVEIEQAAPLVLPQIMVEHYEANK